MVLRFDVSDDIIEEVMAITDKEYLEVLAKDILRFELNNWQKERTRYSSKFEKMIEKAARRKSH